MRKNNEIVDGAARESLVYPTFSLIASGRQAGGAGYKRARNFNLAFVEIDFWIIVEPRKVVPRTHSTAGDRLVYWSSLFSS
jgi:hypothetical protein